MSSRGFVLHEIVSEKVYTDTNNDGILDALRYRSYRESIIM